MEQRKARRKRVDMHAVVRYERLGLVSGRVRDIGTGGMGLEAGPVVLPRDASVEVHFRLPDRAGSKAVALAASVAWVRNGGMGLTFRNPAPEVFRRIHSVVHGHPGPDNPAFCKRFHG